MQLPNLRVAHVRNFSHGWAEGPWLSWTNGELGFLGAEEEPGKENQ